MLDRTFRIIGCLADHPGSRIAQIASATGIPLATTGRLIKQLHAAGLADPVPLQGGWCVGPVAYAWTNRHPFRGLPLAVLEPGIRRIAAAWGCGASLTCLRGVRRVNLMHITRPGRPTATPFVLSDDIWSTAGGRLLVAMLPVRQRRRLVDAIGLPGSRWPGLLTWRELDVELRAVRQQGFAEVANAMSLAVAFPVTDPSGACVASLGVYHDPRMPVRKSRGLRQAVRRLIARHRASAGPTMGRTGGR